MPEPHSHIKIYNIIRDTLLKTNRQDILKSGQTTFFIFQIQQGDTIEK